MKKLLAGLLSAAMVFTLAGCGSSKDHLATIQDIELFCMEETAEYGRSDDRNFLNFVS